MRRIPPSSSLFARGIVRLLAGTVLFAGSTAAFGQAPQPTTVTMTALPAAVVSQHPVTLTASVTTNGHPITRGQVEFCDASAPFCEDLAILGTAQVKADGTAVVRMLLPNGSHSIYARFLGTRGAAAFAAGSSKASPAVVEVSGKQQPVSAEIFTAGSAASRTLSATIDLGAAPATGNVLFLDATDNHQIASAPLGASTAQYNPGSPLYYQLGGNNYISNSGVGDFNNDGIPDLVTVVLQDNATVLLSVSPGDPAHPGHFLPPITTRVPGNIPQGVAVADYNGDGILDVAYVDALGIAGDYYSGGIYVALGDAAHPGHFLPTQFYAPSNAFFSIVQGDFNGDGLPDIAAMDYDADKVTVILNDPAHPGKFLTPTLYPAAASAGVALVTADLDGDGILDLAVGGAKLGGAGEIAILHGDPANPGKFLAPVFLYSGPHPIQAIQVADFNQDGVPDLASANDGTRVDADLSVFLADAKHPGSFLAPTVYIGDKIAGGQMATADFNGDGVLDVTVASHIYQDSYPAFTPIPSNADIYYGDPAHPGQFTTPVMQQTGLTTQGPNVPDLNGDGLPDFAFGSFNYYYGGLSVYLGERTQTATAPTTNTGGTSYAYATYQGDATHTSVSSCDIALDLQPSSPTISDVQAYDVTSSSVKISWKTNVPTYGVVEYNVDPRYYPLSPTSPMPQNTPWNATPSTTHYVELTNLASGAYYQYFLEATSYFSGCSHWTTTGPAYYGGYSFITQ